MLKLHLELMYELEEAEREVLRKYGKVRERISWDILVPADMPLHNLHYAIQKAFGWQNSHLHHFTYEDELLENLFGGKFISWVPFCGLYFRFPSEDFDDLYWDDDYEEGYSVKSWLRSKYTGPYYYGGNSEHYLAAQLAARFFLQENRTVKITVVEEVEGELKDQVLETERPICVAADGLPVMDDAGGIRGYCELLRVVKGKEESEVSAFESKEDAKDWARMMGWTGRKNKAKNGLVREHFK